MLEFYPQIRLAHISFVLMSGSLFALRGTLLLAGSRHANHIALRWLAYAIDCSLLTAALMLAVMLQLYPFVVDWLTVKVLLLVVYIGLGYYALHGPASRPVRAVLLCAALSVFLFMISVARAHHPLGIFHMLALKPVH